MEQAKRTEITKGKILEAAENIFSQKGFSAARIDEIADTAGVNKRMVYAHYGNKEQLYKKILYSAYEKLSANEMRIAETKAESIDDLRNVIEDNFDFLANNKSFVRLIMWENLEEAKHIDFKDIKLFSGIEKLLLTGVEKGFIRKDLDIEQTAMSFNMFCFSAFSNIKTMSGMLGKDLENPKEIQARCSHIADVLVNYIRNGEETL